MKKRWGWWNNTLDGITWERWRTLRARHPIDPHYRHRAAFLTLSSCRNSVIARREERQYGAAIAATEIRDPPLFVLGHWRSGTTHLHNLLACDAERFAWPDSIQTSFPSTFLCAGETIRRQFAALVPSTRPMDDVALTSTTPQEDEFALCVAGLRSPCLGMVVFPRAAEHYDRYLSFRDVPPLERQEWASLFLWFLRKLTFSLGRPLLLKSPPHTARIRLLLELFPRARFVHVHRHPYVVVQSTLHTIERNQALSTLQRPPPDQVEPVLRRYTSLHDAFFADRDLIPEGQFHELAYEDLVDDPVQQLRETYNRLRLDGFEALRPRLEAYVATLYGYSPNRFPELPPELRARVNRACARSFETWNYRP